jgi:hypothetical protein
MNNFKEIAERKAEHYFGAAHQKHFYFDRGEFIAAILSALNEALPKWIPVPEGESNGMPEPGTVCAFEVKSLGGDSNYDGMILGGKYQGFRFGYHEFTVPGIGFSASRYMVIALPDA